MKYHVKMQYGTNTHFFWNYSEDSVIEDVVVPFISGQVIFIRDGETKRLFNMKTATFLNIYRTKKILEFEKEKSIIDQIKEPSFAENDCTKEIMGKIKSTGSSENLSSLIQKALQPPKSQVFVVMKFGNEILDSAYEGAYKTVAKEFGLECLRIDEIQDSGKISDQILESISESKYVLCDLTGARPNCYYETGFAHALGKEIVLLANKKEKVHFDLQGHRFIQWSTEEELRKKLRERFAALESERGREE